ncbi:MAG: hypothetical protein HPY82_03565 [Gammaproteobacteria bacterium]|nr:hypothetical protein [Gammaproteobacteria bacterium]
MNWNDRNYFSTEYFDDLVAAIRSHDFPLYGDVPPRAEQIGHWIVERVDHVLAPNPAATLSPELMGKAISAFEVCSEFFAEEVTAYFREHAGNHAFHGLFHTSNLDLYAMWCRIAKRTNSSWHSEENWLHKLACALLRDVDFGDKMTEAHACCSQGMSRKQTLDQIEQHHRDIGSHNTSAKSLLLLDLL